MTQHHPTTTPADTPAAPADGEDEAGLNAEIATLFGYQWRLGGSIGHECRFLSPPDTHEGREAVGVNYPAYTMDEVFPPATEADKICRDWNRHVPRFASDPAAAFGLLAHVLTISREQGNHYSVKELAQTHSERWYCGIETMNGEHVTCYSAVTIERAVALACRDALAALKEKEVTL